MSIFKALAVYSPNVDRVIEFYGANFFHQRTYQGDRSATG